VVHEAEEGDDGAGLVRGRLLDGGDGPPAEVGGRAAPRVVDAVRVQEAGDGGGGDEVAGRVVGRLPPGRPRGLAHARQAEGDAAVGRGDGRQVVAGGVDHGVAEGVQFVQDPEGDLDRFGLAGGAAQVGFEGVTEAAVRVLVAAQRVEDALAGAAGEQGREAEPVQQSGVAQQVALRTSECVHVRDATRASRPGSCTNRTYERARTPALVRIGRTNAHKGRTNSYESDVTGWRGPRSGTCGRPARPGRSPRYRR